MDATPQPNSTNAVMSGGVYSALDNLGTEISEVNSNLGQKVNNTSQEAHIVFNSYDFNDYTKSGFYRINSGSAYSNIPSTDASWGQLIVSANGDTVMQIYAPITTSNMWVRCFQVTSSGYNFTNWKKLAFA